jgi:hypothetical protein
MSGVKADTNYSAGIARRPPIRVFALNKSCHADQVFGTFTYRTHLWTQRCGESRRDSLQHTATRVENAVPPSQSQRGFVSRPVCLLGSMRQALSPSREANTAYLARETVRLLQVWLDAAIVKERAVFRRLVGRGRGSEIG